MGADAGARQGAALKLNMAEREWNFTGAAGEFTANLETRLCCFYRTAVPLDACDKYSAGFVET
jgi:hypothetical protein